MSTQSFQDHPHAVSVLQRLAQSDMMKIDIIDFCISNGESNGEKLLNSLADAGLVKFYGYGAAGVLIRITKAGRGELERLAPNSATLPRRMAGIFHWRRRRRPKQGRASAIASVELSHNDAVWVGAAGLLGTVAAILAGLAGVLAATSKASLWTSLPMIVTYVAAGLAVGCLVCAAHGVPFPVRPGKRGRLT